MDFSQLPKMSNTPSPPASEQPPSATVDASASAAAEAAPRERVVYVTAPQEQGFGGMWLSLISGIIFLLLGMTFARFLAAKASGRDFVTGWLQADGVTPVRYFELQGGTAWSDCGLFLMGVALLVDAVLLGILSARGRPNQAMVLIAVVITSTAVALNAGVVVYLISIGITLPLYSLIAVAVGGFVMFDHAPLLKRRA